MSRRITRGRDDKKEEGERNSIVSFFGIPAGRDEIKYSLRSSREFTSIGRSYYRSEEADGDDTWAIREHQV